MYAVWCYPLLLLAGTWKSLVSGDARMEDLLGKTLQYDYKVRYTLEDPANHTAPLSALAQHALSAGLRVSTVWRSPESQFDSLFHIKPFDVQRTSDGLNDLPFIYRVHITSDGRLQTDTFFLNSETDESAQLKRALSRSLGSIYRHIHEESESTASTGHWKVNHCGVLGDLKDNIDYGQGHSRLLMLRPDEKFGQSTEKDCLLTGRENSWNSFRMVESRQLFLPWTETAVHRIKSEILLKETERLTTDAAVLALRGKNFDDTLTLIRRQFKDDTGIFKVETTTNEFASAGLLAAELKSLRKFTLKNKAATPEASRAFLRICTAVKMSTKSELMAALHETLKLKKKQKSSVNFLIDAFAAHQSMVGLETVTEVLDYHQKPYHLELFRRYLVASAFSQTANANVIRKLLELLEKPVKDLALEETLALSLGALTFTLRRNAPEDAAGKELDNLIGREMLRKLENCQKGTDSGVIADCSVMWLRAIGNLGCRETRTQILEHVLRGGRATPAAIKAFRRLDPFAPGSDVYDETVVAIWNVYENSSASFDSTGKIAAVDWLIRMLARVKDVRKIAHLARIIEHIPNLQTDELRTYVMTALQNNGNIIQPNMLRDAFSLAYERSKDSTYAQLGVTGQSVAFEGSLLRTGLLNSTYSLAMEFSGGSMKTSTVGVSLNDKDSTLPIVTFGLFSRGLGSFMGATEESDASETATAGLALELLDVSLPSVVFFNGFSELMSLALSAGGSDPVAELQFNLLTLDAKVNDPLHSGIPVRTDVLTALSLDISGFVQVSLWGRTFNSLVRNRAAIATEIVTKLGHPAADSPFIQNIAERIKGKMDFVTNVDFSSFPVKLCMQMSNSPVAYWRYHKRRSSLPGSPAVSQCSRSFSPGKSYFLGARNAKYCKEMS
ncbi:putative Microsomal triglyceride transfer protein large subunit [Hypsibius exemplaris]|uniref:Microsomal triglyceride transfer protein large subunit n=1 Tax=Hypsibius exemplaris TaxID=2072580 RepID=A0A1W0WJY7_HYPEX|nr:putative Microsomal triglyceride transfer protein large subunit [Hypsibius exemplaris]